jgi:hypothetical protein
MKLIKIYIPLAIVLLSCSNPISYKPKEGFSLELKRASTTINFDLASESLVNISIYDVLGLLVTELVNDYLGSGNHQITWGASNVSSGNYIIVMTASAFVASQKLTLIK